MRDSRPEARPPALLYALAAIVLVASAAGLAPRVGERVPDEAFDRPLLLGASSAQVTPATYMPAPAGSVEPAPEPIPAAEPAPEPPPQPAPAPAAPKPKPGPIVPIGGIEIPKIGLVHQIYEGIELRIIDRGPSHWPGTAMPGETGNAVFAGHRVTHSHPFRNIDQLEPGDLVFFYVGGSRHTYRVTGDEVVTPKALWITDATPHATATLFACHPPGSARYRFVVRMELVTG